MKVNSDKYHIFISGNKLEHLWAKIGPKRIWENTTVKLLVISIDNELKLDEHLSNVRPRANSKLSTLTRIRKYFDFKGCVRYIFASLFFMFKREDL